MPERLKLTIDKFTFYVENSYWYSRQGVWAQRLENVIRIGLSDFLQQRSGDIAFAEVRPAGTQLAVNSEAATIETIKTNFDVASPLTGTIMRVNPLMITSPEIINEDPYGQGWLCEIEATDWESDSKNLLDAPAYFAVMKQEAENEVKE